MRIVTISWKAGKFIVIEQGIEIWSGYPKQWHFLQLAIHGAGLKFSDQVAMQNYLKHYPN